MSPILKIYYKVAFNIFSQEMYFVGDEQCRLHILFYIIAQCSYFFCHQMHRICVNIFLESNLWGWLMVDKNHVTNQTFPILSICGSCLQSINQKSPGSGFVTNSLFHSSSHIRPFEIQFVRGKIGGDAKQIMKR